MSAQEWLDRTRAITDAAWDGSWTWRLDDADRVTLHASGSVPFDLIRDDEYRGATEEVEFIAHARTALPQAVAALRAVLDLHQPRNRVTQSASGHLVDTPGPCTACDWDWPCPTITAINDAIGDHP